MSCRRRPIRSGGGDFTDAEIIRTPVGDLIECLIPTKGNAFAMSVAGRRYVECKEAGRALMKEILTLVQLQ